MSQKNPEDISLYDEARLGLISLFNQLGVLFIFIISILILFNGNPPSIIIKVTFIVGILYTAIAEGYRIINQKKNKCENEITENSQENSSNNASKINKINISIVYFLLSRTSSSITEHRNESLINQSRNNFKHLSYIAFKYSIFVLVGFLLGATISNIIGASNITISLFPFVFAMIWRISIIILMIVVITIIIENLRQP